MDNPLRTRTCVYNFTAFVNRNIKIQEDLTFQVAINSN